MFSSRPSFIFFEGVSGGGRWYLAKVPDFQEKGLLKVLRDSLVSDGLDCV